MSHSLVDQMRDDARDLSDEKFAAKYRKWTGADGGPFTKDDADPDGLRFSGIFRFGMDLAAFCDAENRRLVEYRAGRPVTRLNTTLEN